MARKVHLAYLKAYVLCGECISHNNSHYPDTLITNDPQQITCLKCLKALDKRNRKPIVHLSLNDSCNLGDCYPIACCSTMPARPNTDYSFHKTADPLEVTCKVCKKTKMYKQLLLASRTREERVAEFL